MKKPACTIAIIIINVVVFFCLSFLGMTEDAEFMLEHGAVYAPYVVGNGEYYRVFTAMFLHFGFQHLMNNMIMLGAVGWYLEREIGGIRFLAVYLGSGILGMLLSLFQDLYKGTYAVTAGASGAIFGILGMLLYVAFRNRGRVGDLSGRGLLFMAVLSLYYGFSSSGVDNAAHIGGLIGGILLGVLLYRKRQRKPGAHSRL